jgi:hypothetical protein
MYDDFPSRVPWNWQPYLSELCAEANVDYDQFIAGLAENKTDQEIANEFNTREQTIKYLREHFENYGVGSVMGQD